VPSLSLYAKALVAFFTTLGGVTATVAADGAVDPVEVVLGLCTVGAATFGVFIVPNERVSTHLHD
jgi:hypothetical protein